MFKDLSWVELKIFSYKDIQYTRVELKIFSRFAFKLVFRFSGRSLPWDKPATSKCTSAHDLHVIFQVLSVKAYWSVNKWYINIS